MTPLVLVGLVPLLFGMILVAVYMAAHHTLRTVLRALNPAWLWFTGLPIGDGQSRTNATWTQRSHGPRPVLHNSGHAIWWHHLPRLHRSGIRTGASVVFLGVLCGLVLDEQVTVILLAVLGVVGFLVGGWHLYYRARNWKHERHYVKPLEGSLVRKIPVRPERIAIERADNEVKAVEIVWPPDTQIESGDQKEVLQAVTARLAIEAPDVEWRVKGRERYVRFTQSEPVTSFAEWNDQFAAAVKAAGPSELVYGIGKHGVIVKAKYSDSPHLAIPGGSGGGKALALNTLLPTPGGWITMGDIKVGDEVFAETGAPARVVAATEVMHDRRCYEVQFSDGSVIVADAGHQWVVETSSARKSFGRVKNPPATCPTTVMTTEVMAASLRARRTYKCDETNYSVKVAAPIQCMDADLPVPPYTLGAWLGDGATVTGSITSADTEIISEIEAEGETTWVVPSTVKANHASYRVKGLNVRLRAAGVLGNKHIPIAYLRASEGQRRALLAGLLDTDGYCATDGQANYYSTLERLARDVHHLVATLGYKATLTSKIARLNGKDCGTVWIVTFTPADKVFRLPRKVARQVIKVRMTAGRRYVTDIRPVPSVPVRCIEVDSPSHLYLAGETCIPTHNSNLAALLLLQEMMRGSLIFNLDPKWISHLWLQGLPNVINAHDAADLHLALAWLGKELVRRTKSAYYSAAGTGRVQGSVGPRIIVLCEELNYGMPGLKDYWAEILAQDKKLPKEDRDPGLPKKSPAIAALSALSCAGRASDMHMALIAQLLTVESTGVKDSTIRTNAGTKAMIRHDGPGWAMAVGKQVPMPAPSTIPGRIQLVTGGEPPRETQVPYLHLDDADEEVSEAAVKWARELAVSGIPAQIPGGPEGVPWQLWPASVVGRTALPPGAAQGTETRPTSFETSTPVLISLRAALAEETLRFTGRDPLGAARKAAGRPGFPEKRAWDGKEALYFRSELREWQNGKVRVLQ